jgi:hypothetical protein
MPQVIGLTQLSIPMFEPSESTTSLKSTSLREDFPVRIYPSPENGQAYEKARALVFGSNFGGSLANFDPVSCCWRMFQASFLSEQPEFLPTLPKWVMWDEQALYPLVTSERRTNESVGGAWPTPRARDYLAWGEEAAARRQDLYSTMDLGNAVKQWATPNTRDWHSQGAGMNPKAHSVALSTMVEKDVKAWATPNSADAIGTHGGGQSRSLRTDTHGQGGQLNPDWVETLMGLPIGWTSLDGLPDPANPSTPTSRRVPSRASRPTAQHGLKRSATAWRSPSSTRSWGQFSNGSKRRTRGRQPRESKTPPMG